MRSDSVHHTRDNREARNPLGADQSALALEAFPMDSDSLPSIGEYLARQRELRGISRDDLCNLTRIPLRSLERLESGVFDQLDDGFVRGFVLTVAEALGLDPGDTLARMSQEPIDTDESPQLISTQALMRVGVLFAGLALVLISVGIISVAVQYVPGNDGDSTLVMRRDPVRVLAEARVGPGFEATQVLPPPQPAPLPAPIENSELERLPSEFVEVERRSPTGEDLQAEVRTLEP